MNNLTSAKDTHIAALYQRGYSDPVAFCQVFLPHWFGTEIPWIHWGILAILTRQVDFLLNCPNLDKLERHFSWLEDFDNEESPRHHVFVVHRDSFGEPTRIDLHISQFTEIMMPRGFAKTTLSNAAIIYLICYKIREFLVYASETGPHAEQQLRNIRAEFETNFVLRSVFGDLTSKQRSGNKWTDELLEFANGCVLAAKSRGKQIRGMLNKGRRPDFQLLDDVEDEESVKTDAQRDKSLEWLYASVIPAFKKGGDGWLLITGTLLHKSALLMQAAKSGDFNCIRFGAIDPDGDPLWEWNMSHAEYEKKKASYARVGKLSTFYREYMNQLRATEDAKFRDEFFVLNYNPPHEIIQKAISIDPAISDKPGADDCAFAVGGMMDNGIIKVLECFGEKGMSPRDQINTYFNLRHKYRAPAPILYNGVEAQAYQMALVHLLREEMFRKGDYFEITEIRHKQRKTERIEGILQPRFANNYIEFNKDFPKLRTQLLDWPNGHDDLPDALAMMVSLLDPMAAMAADPEKDLAEDEYEPLVRSIGNYRNAP